MVGRLVFKSSAPRLVSAHMWLPGSLHAHRSQSIYHHWSLSRSNNNSINSAENDRHHQQQCKRCKVINIRKNVRGCITGTVVTRQFWNAYFSSKLAITWLAPSLLLLPSMAPFLRILSLKSISFKTAFGNISLLPCFAMPATREGPWSTKRPTAHHKGLFRQ